MTFCKISLFAQRRKANFAPGGSIEAIGLFFKYVIFGMIVVGAFISTDHDRHLVFGVETRSLLGREETPLLL